MNADSSRVRLGVLGIATLSLFGALFARLWYLQVVSAHDLRLAANTNHIRTVPLPAPRGRILDRNGIVLVDNRLSLGVTINWQRYTKLRPARRKLLLEGLAEELTRTDPAKPVRVQDLTRRLADPRFSRFRPIPVADDVPEEVAVFLAEHRREFPMVVASRTPVRNYRFGSLLSHVLGYVGSLSDAQWRFVEHHQDPLKPYDRNDQIGKTGVEATLERQLRGTPGQVRYEVDARNQPIRELDHRDPVPGNDLWLTIDSRSQALTEESLQAGLIRARLKTNSLGSPSAPAGSSIVEDPRNGQILAMASYPTFAPADFSNGITSKRYRELTAPGNFQPLTNRAVGGTYAPGSTFKLATAYAGTKLGLIHPEDTILDPGYFDIPGCAGASCKKFNSGKAAHGTINLQHALTVSSDVYFYKLGFDIWAARDRLHDDSALQNAAGDLGYGQPTGIELPGEARGRLPTPTWLREYDRRINGHATNAGLWTAGVNMNVAVGQGDVLATPLQVANAYAAFANGGTLYRPSLVLKVTAPMRADKVVSAFRPQVVRTLQFPPGVREAMLAGFAGVTTDPGGTATSAFVGFNPAFAVAGKTGTAQVGVDPKTHKPRQDNSLFAGFGPVSAPQYLGTTVIEAGGFGSDAAAPVVRNILEPISTGTVPAAPKGGVFNANDIFKLQKNPAGQGPND